MHSGPERWTRYLHGNHCRVHHAQGVLDLLLTRSSGGPIVSTCARDFATDFHRPNGVRKLIGGATDRPTRGLHWLADASQSIKVPARRLAIKILRVDRRSDSLGGDDCGHKSYNPEIPDGCEMNGCRPRSARLGYEIGIERDRHLTGRAPNGTHPARD